MAKLKRNSDEDKYNKIILVIAIAVTVVLSTLVVSFGLIIKLNNDLQNQKEDLARLIYILSPQIDQAVSDQSY